MAVDTFNYVNFDVRIVRDGAGYRIEVKSEGGEPSAPFVVPFTPDELSRLRAAISGPVRDSAAMPPLDPAPPPAPAPAVRDVAVAVLGGGADAGDGDCAEMARQFGERLYDAVFVDAIGKALAVAEKQASDRGDYLRFRLQLAATPELAGLPWEYLYDRSKQNNLAVRYESSIVRHLSQTGPTTALTVKPPIHMLVMIADPTRQLDVEGEWQRILGALAGLRDTNQVVVERCPAPTLESLLTKAAEKPYHIFHFIGHGGEKHGEPVLIFGSPGGPAQEVRFTDLDDALNNPSLRMVVLNSCDGAIGPPSNPLGGLAQRLLTRFPAVIAMQHKISDDAALKFAGNLYGAIATGMSVDRALVQTRKLMRIKAVNPNEWATPVLYMSQSNGKLFDIDRPTAEQLREKQIEALSADARQAITDRRFDDAKKKIEQILGLQLPNGQ